MKQDFEGLKRDGWIGLFQVMFLMVCLSLASAPQGMCADQSDAVTQYVINKTDVPALKQMGEASGRQYRENKARSLEMARQKGWVIRQKFQDGRVMELQGVDELGFPISFKRNKKSEKT
jgi:hypothetical protein